MCAQHLFVSQSLDNSLNMLAIDSRELWRVAHTGYQQSGRGALFTVFPNIEALESEGMNAWQYLPRSELVKMDYGNVLHFVDMYNPNTHFVALAAVNIRKPRAGKDNTIMLCKMIGRDVQLATTPNYGADGEELHCQTTELKDSKPGNVLKCAAPSCTVTHGLRVCSGCRDARYCGKECQLLHRAQHKEVCHVLKVAKAQAKEHLRTVN
jgi:MYND finger